MLKCVVVEPVRGFFSRSVRRAGVAFWQNRKSGSPSMGYQTIESVDGIGYIGEWAWPAGPRMGAAL